MDMQDLPSNDQLTGDAPTPAPHGPMLPTSHLQVCVLKRLRLMHALHCMQWKKSMPRPCPRRHTLQKGQW